MSHVTHTLEPRQWRQLVIITAAAVALFLGLRVLPTGTNLSHMDFRVDPRAGNAIEFCDPLNPQFIPVVAARSPVTLALRLAGPARAGSEVRATVTLRTSSRKPVAAEDLLVTHTRRLHLLIIDPTLTDYQHVHPDPTREAGDWTFAFTPRAAGVYRVFADFTPAATSRGLYASADLEVAGPSSPSSGSGNPEPALRLPALRAVELEGFQFGLATAQVPPRANQPLDLTFTMRRADGGPVPLEPVMGAFTHLVAFDEARSGFAHLHPQESELVKPPDPARPTLHFKLTIPKPGRYLVWAQVNLGGREMFVPFAVEVLE